MSQSLPVQQILDTMHERFRDYPMTELHFKTPFQLLVAVILSAQTTDKQVNVVTEKLFKKVKWPQDIIDMGFDDLGEHIRTVGLWKSKQKNVFKMAQQVLDLTLEDSSQPQDVSISQETWLYDDAGEVYEKWGYVLPDTLKGMTALGGVGVKTAKVVLHVLYGQRYVAADTHVHRVMNRLGVVSTKTPEQTSEQLETIIPDDYKDVAHRVIIYFGRYICIARKPLCDECPLQAHCPWYVENVK